uniref:SCP domain-containing protein n=1 Tax=Mesocestoides corti TaxID=53468 RepID=A0A5K3FKA7_MESCO
MRELICLLALLVRAFAKIPSESEREIILECNTQQRGNVTPNATNMMLLNYSTKAQDLAEKTLTICNTTAVEKDPDFKNVGALFITSPNETLEYKDLCNVANYSYDLDPANCSGNCETYKQVSYMACYFKLLRFLCTIL